MITSGSREWAAYYSREGALFLRIGNLTREHITLRLDDVVHVVPPAGSEGARTQVVAGDILISITADLGIIGVVPNHFEEAYVNQHIALMRPLAKFNPRWIARLLASGATARHFQTLNHTGAKAGMNLPAVGSLPNALPFVVERNAATDALDTIDTRIADECRHVGKLGALKTVLTNDLLTGRVRVCGTQ